MRTPSPRVMTNSPPDSIAPMSENGCHNAPMSTILPVALPRPYVLRAAFRHDVGHQPFRRVRRLVRVAPAVCGPWLSHCPCLGDPHGAGRVEHGLEDESGAREKR